MAHDDPALDPDFSSKLRKLSRFEKFTVGTFAVLGALFVASTASGMLKTNVSRDQLLARRDAMRTQLPDEALSVPRKVSTFAMELAKGGEPREILSPKALATLAKPGVYLRVLASNAKSEETVQRAAKDSSKDAFASCLMTAVQAEPEGPLEACEPGTACANETTGKLSNLRGLLGPTHPFHEAWTEDAQRADGMRIAVLASELDRVAHDLPKAAKIAREADFAMVVVDEIPQGTEMPWFQTGLQAVTQIPHHARVGVMDLRSGEVVLQMRVFADDTPAGGEAGKAVLRQVQGCGLGLRVAERLTGR